jgi:predicted DNA-binding transcriptional regulator YafY
VNPLGASRPATRLLSMLEVLQARGRASGREFARRLEVDPPTVRRDAVKLSELGIQNVWVPESRSWVLSCELVGEAIGPR